MKLLILRHAIAVERPEWKGSDAERPLTDKGRHKMKAAAEGMKSFGLTFDWILSSPFRRAFDTAEIVTKIYKCPKKLRTTRTLAPEGDPKTLVRHLALDFKAWETVMLVGHEPYLSNLIGTLLAGSPVAMDFKKGGLCLLKADALTLGPCATLEWMLTPKLLRALR